MKKRHGDEERNACAREKAENTVPATAAILNHYAGPPRGQSFAVKPREFLGGRRRISN